MAGKARGRQVRWGTKDANLTWKHLVTNKKSTVRIVTNPQGKLYFYLENF
jgi:hypothetical protein